MKKEVRVRFAPSPTGTLHLGSARTALFNWLFARHEQGKFILRIEDTDRERSAEKFEAAIIDDLKWLGLEWDEGPFVDGEHGPYHQSLRGDIYDREAKKLIDKGLVYKCYCTEQELEASREGMMAAGTMPKYGGKCRYLTEEECAAKEASGTAPSLRFRVPEGEIAIDDLIRGKVSFNSEVISDFIIMRSDGVASFNFAVVVDDADMRISHVIRGEDHLTNTARHVMLFEALGYELPKFAHISMLFGTDGTKLSKRHGATAVSDYRDMGFVPSAIINYLASLGWSSESARDVFLPDELIEDYSIGRMSKSPSIFDIDKLTWLNGQHIRMMDTVKLTGLLAPLIDEAGLFDETEAAPDIIKVVEALQTSLERLTDVAGLAKMFYEPNVSVEPAASELIGSSRMKEIAVAAIEILQDIEDFEDQSAKDFLKVLADKLKPIGIKGKELFLPMRAALTGRLSGPELHSIIDVFGPGKCIDRLYQYKD